MLQKQEKLFKKQKKKEEERVVSEQAPPAAKAKEKPDRIPLPNDKKEEKKIVKKKQNPEEIKPQIRQSSEFEKKEILIPIKLQRLLTRQKKLRQLSKKRDNQITQSNKKIHLQVDLHFLKKMH